MPAPTDILGKIGQAIAAEVNTIQELVDNLNEITGDLTVTGNLTVNGTTTTINATTLQVEDNIIELNKTESGAMGSATSGIQVHLGQEADAYNTQNYRDTSAADFDAHWGVTAEGITIYDNPTAYTLSGGGSATMTTDLADGTQNVEGVIRRRHFFRVVAGSYSYDYAVMLESGTPRVVNGVTGNGLYVEDWSDGVTAGGTAPRSGKSQLIGVWNVAGIQAIENGWSIDWKTDTHAGLTNIVVNSLTFEESFTPLNPATIIWNNNTSRWEIKSGSDVANVKANFKIASGTALTLNGVAFGDYNNFLVGYNYTP